MATVHGSGVPGEDEGQQLTNMPAGYTGATNAARLFSFLSISDAHITDKESPCQAIYLELPGQLTAVRPRAIHR